MGYSDGKKNLSQLSSDSCIGLHPKNLVSFWQRSENATVVFWNLFFITLWRQNPTIPVNWLGVPVKVFTELLAYVWWKYFKITF